MLEIQFQRATIAQQRIAGRLVPQRAGALDPDYLGAHVAKHHSAERRRAETRQLENPDALERPASARGCQSASMMVTLARPPPSHIACSP